MNFVNPIAERAYPILRVAVEHDVANVEPGLDPRAFEFIHVGGHFERAEQKPVPDFFDGYDDLQFLGKRDELADIFLGARPGIVVEGFRIDDGGNQQHRVRAPELGVVERSLHPLQGLFDHGRVA